MPTKNLTVPQRTVFWSKTSSWLKSLLFWHEGDVSDGCVTSEIVRVSPLGWCAPDLATRFLPLSLDTSVSLAFSFSVPLLVSSSFHSPLLLYTVLLFHVSRSSHVRLSEFWPNPVFRCQADILRERSVFKWALNPYSWHARRTDDENPPAHVHIYFNPNKTLCQWAYPCCTKTKGNTRDMFEE